MDDNDDKTPSDSSADVNASVPASESEVVTQTKPPGLLASEDWWAVWLGCALLLATLLLTWLGAPADSRENLTQVRTLQSELADLEAQRSSAAGADRKALTARMKEVDETLQKARSGVYVNPLKPWLAKPGGWKANPLAAFWPKGKNGLPGLAGAFVVLLISFAIGNAGLGRNVFRFIPGFCIIFLLATFAYLLAGQAVVKQYNLEYALWALIVGLLISNTAGTPAFLKPACQTEFYIKTGLVILGAEVLMAQLFALGLPGICIAWIVTPVVLISTYLFGQYVLRIPSRSLNMVISADMSVCGVSAAIATAAACKAKKEELSLAIRMSVSFPVIMMLVMPAIIDAVGMNAVLGGAWLGGTIDSTGAVAAAGGLLGEVALKVAATIKMIQNILIGVTAFCVATYWTLVVEKDSSGQRPDVMEIWYRFPKFVIGFIAASIVFSLIAASGSSGELLVNAVTGGASKTLRGWMFCLAFVSIGLETNFRQLSQQLAGGKPLMLYVCGQSLNLCLTLWMAWLMFEKVFPNVTESLLQSAG